MNPVKSRLCEIPGSGSNSPKIGYIKLTTFNQNASGMHSFDVFLQVLSTFLVYYLSKLYTSFCRCGEGSN